MIIVFFFCFYCLYFFFIKGYDNQIINNYNKLIMEISKFGEKIMKKNRNQIKVYWMIIYCYKGCIMYL